MPKKGKTPNLKTKEAHDEAQDMRGQHKTYQESHAEAEQVVACACKPQKIDEENEESTGKQNTGGKTQEQTATCLTESVPKASP